MTKIIFEKFLTNQRGEGPLTKNTRSHTSQRRNRVVGSVLTNSALFIHIQSFVDGTRIKDMYNADHAIRFGALCYQEWQQYNPAHMQFRLGAPTLKLALTNIDTALFTLWVKDQDWESAAAVPRGLDPFPLLVMYPILAHHSNPLRTLLMAVSDNSHSLLLEKVLSLDSVQHLLEKFTFCECYNLLLDWTYTKLYKCVEQMLSRPTILNLMKNQHKGGENILFNAFMQMLNDRKARITYHFSTLYPWFQQNFRIPMTAYMSLQLDAEMVCNLTATGHPVRRSVRLREAKAS